MTGLLGSIWETMTGIATGFIELLSTIFNGLIALFWTPGTGEAAGEFTFLGILVLIGTVTPLVFYGLTMLIGWFRRMLARGKK